MSELYPTKTRLALLRDVAAGHVYRVIDGTDYDSNNAPALPRRVVVAIAELQKAGWVQLVGVGGGLCFENRWQLTGAGRAVLDTHGGA